MAKIKLVKPESSEEVKPSRVITPPEIKSDDTGPVQTTPEELSTAAPRTNGSGSITVGNPEAIADLAIDQSHLEELANPEASSSVVACRKPPKGVFFTVQPEPIKPWKNRKFFFLLEMEGRDPYVVAPTIAKAKNEEDTIRPVLLARYVTMAGEEGLWPLKLDPPEGKSNHWNASALNILEIAGEGKWVRLVSTKNHYRHQLSKKTFTEVPPRFSDRPFNQLVNMAFKDRVITSLDHEVWEALENGSVK
jgi:hypothetical protein